MAATDELRSPVDCAAALEDDELVMAVQRLVREEPEISARLLVHLGEVDARQLYRQHAYSSMFEYCVQALHLSEAEAYLRIGAARLCRRFPRVLAMFAAGELHLSGLKLLAPVLDEASCDECSTTRSVPRTFALPMAHSRTIRSNRKSSIWSRNEESHRDS